MGNLKFILLFTGGRHGFLQACDCRQYHSGVPKSLQYRPQGVLSTPNWGQEPEFFMVDAFCEDNSEDRKKQMAEEPTLLVYKSLINKEPLHDRRPRVDGKNLPTRMTSDHSYCSGTNAMLDQQSLRTGCDSPSCTNLNHSCHSYPPSDHYDANGGRTVSHAKRRAIRSALLQEFQDVYYLEESLERFQFGTGGQQMKRFPMELLSLFQQPLKIDEHNTVPELDEQRVKKLRKHSPCQGEVESHSAKRKRSLVSCSNAHGPAALQHEDEQNQTRDGDTNDLTPVAKTNNGMVPRLSSTNDVPPAEEFASLPAALVQELDAWSVLASNDTDNMPEDIISLESRNSRGSWMGRLSVCEDHVCNNMSVNNSRADLRGAKTNHVHTREVKPEEPEDTSKHDKLAICKKEPGTALMEERHSNILSVGEKNIEMTASEKDEQEFQERMKSLDLRPHVGDSQCWQVSREVFQFGKVPPTAAQVLRNVASQEKCVNSSAGGVSATPLRTSPPPGQTAAKPVFVADSSKPAISRVEEGKRLDDAVEAMQDTNQHLKDKHSTIRSGDHPVQKNEEIITPCATGGTGVSGSAKNPQVVSQESATNVQPRDEAEKDEGATIDNPIIRGITKILSSKSAFLSEDIAKKAAGNDSMMCEMSELLKTIYEAPDAFEMNGRLFQTPRAAAVAAAGPAISVKLNP